MHGSQQSYMPLARRKSTFHCMRIHAAHASNSGVKHSCSFALHWACNMDLACTRIALAIWRPIPCLSSPPPNSSLGRLSSLFLSHRSRCISYPIHYHHRLSIFNFFTYGHLQIALAIWRDRMTAYTHI
jgi:hypothetical protein